MAKNESEIAAARVDRLDDVHGAGFGDEKRSGTGWAHTVLAKAGVRLMELNGVFTVGVWAHRDSPKIRTALRCFHDEDPPVVYLDGSAVPNRYKPTRLAGEPVPLNVLHAMEKNPREAWVIRDRMLAAMGWAGGGAEADAQVG
jgi:hypothetical protein